VISCLILSPKRCRQFFWFASNAALSLARIFNQLVLP
jgi:hypothetical protein